MVSGSKLKKSVSVQTFTLDSDLTLLLPINHSGQPGVVYEIRKMEPRGGSHRIRSVTFLCLFLAIAGIIGFGYFCDSKVKKLTPLPV